MEDAERWQLRLAHARKTRTHGARARASDEASLFTAAAIEAGGLRLLRESRGFVCGTVMTGSEEEYIRRVRAQARHVRSSFAQAELARALVMLRVDELMSKLETGARRNVELRHTLLVTACRAESERMTDIPIRRAWEAARVDRANARKAAKLASDVAQRRRAGVTAEDDRQIERAKAADEAEARLLRVARGLPAIDADEISRTLQAERDEWDEYMRVLPGEEFAGGGFQGVVSEDGSVLSWAGDGTEFLVGAWKARYRVKPWIAELAFARYVAAGTGIAFKSPEDMYKVLKSMGAEDAIREMKVSGVGLPPSGMQAHLLRVSAARALVDAEKRAAEDARLAEEQRALLKSLNSRKVRSIGAIEEDKKRALEALAAEEEKRREAKAVAAAAAAAEDELAKNVFAAKTSASEFLRSMVSNLDPRAVADAVADGIRSAKNAYLKYTEDRAAAALERNKDLAMAVGKVKERLEARKGTLEGINNFKWTYGVHEDARWATEQRELYEADKPFFLRVNKNLGSDVNPVFLWYQRTENPREMISHIVSASFDPAVDPIVNTLRLKGYEYVTHPMLFPGFGFWFVRATGDPITALTIVFDNEDAKKLRNRGFSKLEGHWPFPLIQQSAVVMYRAERMRRKIYTTMSELVRSSETDALEREAASLRARLDDAEHKIKISGGANVALPGGIEYSTLRDAYEHVAAKHAQSKAVQLSEREVATSETAIDFLGLIATDVQQLINRYHAMDAAHVALMRKAKRDKAPPPPQLRVTLEQWYRSIDVDRSPVADALWFIIDPNFDGRLNVPLFLRTVVTFNMFGSDDIVKFVFCVVTQNVLAQVERVLGKVPAPGKAGARGVDRVRNNSVYWKEAVPWVTTEDAKADSNRISVRQFCQLLFTLHAPTSALATTVKAAINRAHSVATLGMLRLFQFRKIVTEYPTLLAPVFQLQNSMQDKLLGQDWWASKRQLFTDARLQVQNESDLELKCVRAQARGSQPRTRVLIHPHHLPLPALVLFFRPSPDPRPCRYKIIEKQRIAAEKEKERRVEEARLKRRMRAFEQAEKKKNKGKGNAKNAAAEDDDGEGTGGDGTDDGSGSGTDTGTGTGSGTDTGTGSDAGTHTGTADGSRTRTRTKTSAGGDTAAAVTSAGGGRSQPEKRASGRTITTATKTVA